MLLALLFGCSRDATPEPDAPKGQAGVDTAVAPTVDSPGDSAEPPTPDVDGDGFDADDDCNDSDPSVHPGAGELCNEVDDDCDGVTDEGASRRFAGWPGAAMTASWPDATDLVVADLDGDGRLDLAANSDDGFSWLANPGGPWIVDGEWAGTWQSVEMEVPLGDTTALAAADLDGDGWTDILHGVTDSHSVVTIGWFRNAAGAGFDTWVEIGSGKPQHSQDPIVTGDFDADGRTDVANADLFWWNDGGGTFTEDTSNRHIMEVATLFPDGSWVGSTMNTLLRADTSRTWSSLAGDWRCESFAAALTPGLDLTGDGRPDVLSAMESLYLCEDDGAGGLTPTATIAVSSTIRESGLLGAWDATGDGWPDLAMDDGDADGDNGDVLVYAGGAGGFTLQQVVTLPTTPPNGGLIVWADWTGTGTTSLLECDNHDKTCTELTPDENGEFPSATRLHPTDFFNYTTSALPADHDGDGDLDLFVVGERYLGWFEQTSPRTFVEVDAANVILDHPMDLRLTADLDGDGAQEIIGTVGREDVWAFAGVSATSLAAPAAALPTGEYGDYPRGMDILAADLDGDGDDELLNGPFAWTDEILTSGFGWAWGLDGGAIWEDVADEDPFRGTLALLNAGDGDGDGRDELLSIESGQIVRVEWDGSAWTQLDRVTTDWDDDLPDGTWVAASLSVDGALLVLDPDAGQLVRVDSASGAITGRWETPTELRRGPIGADPSELPHVGTLDASGTVGGWLQGARGDCVGDVWAEVDGALVPRPVGCLGTPGDRTRVADLDADGVSDLIGGYDALVGVLWGAAEDVKTCE